MIDEKTLLIIWQNAVDIIPPSPNGADDDSVFLGVIENITDAPAGVDAVLAYWTELIDTALQQDGISYTQKLELLTLRGFTFDEYRTLFDIGVRENDYSRYPIYQSLLITTAKERAGVIYQLTKYDYENGYLKLLSRTLRLFNPLLYNFLYEAYNTRTD